MLQVKDYKIKWHHELHSDNAHKMDGDKTYPDNGITRCRISREANHARRLGFSVEDVAVCSKHDNFCYDKGRKISLARAIASADLPKKDRQMIWEAYRYMGGKKRW
jgi:hypothetical protein